LADLAPEKGGKSRKQAPNKSTQRKSNSKARWLVGYKAVLLNLKTIYKLKLPQLTEGKAD
jgi:hypothetical protein